MSEHWNKSALPYFVIVQDQSEVNQQTFNNTRRNSLLTPQTNSDHHGNSSTSTYGNVFSSSQNYYPEIKYVFQDDDDHYDLENQLDEDEEAIVLEMDSNGDEVIGYKSLTPDLQIMNVSIDDKNLTKRISLNTTRAELENFDSLKPDKDLNYIRKLADLYKLRSQQLESIL
ncbi:hypothetical protein BN7_5897 [Wickerhamomyces ciferrii]|uniref:Uncharacterized protein n=1 Tax=Wickerhamomyces ciferrii (strain ATCC 14091 / BCRC 22168 / CBS 111 / JCM 3599 / NBRC 0793 / NRRL Y-1031 F-60-10) TaxID=1206466 RepID=K0KM41_WICCF|nr:uncharacterized protein BN7_5897 [Wickerhamomyces ciferrii]CCH46305.1 hypothetical protein BN7_5897 [Wickerhamomyces ciferrii]